MDPARSPTQFGPEDGGSRFSVARHRECAQRRRARSDRGERRGEEKLRYAARPESSVQVALGRGIALTVVEVACELTDRRIVADDGQGPAASGVSRMAASSASTVLS